MFYVFTTLTGNVKIYNKHTEIYIPNIDIYTTRKV